ncbi:Nucleotidyltransferase [Peniophora sp. CONT]|nr:Nucleotidyltransferase [Peniophora sp. CONT]
MSTKRSTDRRASSSSTASPSPGPVSKRQRVSAPHNALRGRKVHIINAKIENAVVGELLELVERSGAAHARSPEDADVIITAIGMRKRLERHVDWKVATSKAVVHPAWLEDSVAQGKALPCEDYAALRDLKETTCANCPSGPCTCGSTDSDSDTSPPVTPSKPRKPRSSGHREPDVPTIVRTSTRTEIPMYLMPPELPYEVKMDKLPFNTRFSCQRAAPLECVNQELSDTLEIIRRSRLLEGEERSALSYGRAIAVIKSFPKKITDGTRDEAKNLPNIGVKLSKMIDLYLDTGKIPEIEKIRHSERFQALSSFAEIYGIGPSTARHLYAVGVRTMTELEAYYEADTAPESLMHLQGVSQDDAVEPEPEQDDLAIESQTLVEHTGSSPQEMWIKIALSWRHDLAKKISRDEVESIHAIICAELDKMQSGCVSTIVGGYRRGKSECGDVDIVFTHPDGARVPGLCRRFVRQLHDKGLVTHVIHSMGFHSHDPLRTHHWDSLEKALTVFIPPGKTTRRRVDLIFAAPEVYWTAVVGWTGSMMFERDLRSVAKLQGMKFDSSGISRRRDSKLFYPRSEKEIFDMFGLAWVPPELRNADA